MGGDGGGTVWAARGSLVGPSDWLAVPWVVHVTSRRDCQKREAGGKGPLVATPPRRSNRCVVTKDELARNSQPYLTDGATRKIQYRVE